MAFRYVVNVLTLWWLAIVITSSTSNSANGYLIKNGDFDARLNDWTTFVGNGTLGPEGFPEVVDFDTTGEGATKSAKFRVGRNRNVDPIIKYGGGGIRQSVNLGTESQFVLQADVGVRGGPKIPIPDIPPFNPHNADTGRFTLLLGDANGQVTSHGLSFPGKTPIDHERHFSHRVYINSDLQNIIPKLGPRAEVTVKVERKFVDTRISPTQYVDNVVLMPLSELITVYNGGRTGYDASAEGFAWQQLGFLNDDGSPKRQDNDGNIIDGESIIGHVMGKRGGKPIGWRNPTRNKAIIDLSVGKLSDAYSFVHGSGDIRVITHGIYTDNDGDGEATPADRLGGAIQLDRGNAFAGFGSGTGLPGTKKYDFPFERSTASMGLRLTCCFSRDDPDGANGPVKSVAATASEISGVSGVTGFNGSTKTTVFAQWTSVGPLPNGVSVQNVQDAINAQLVGQNGGVGQNETYGDWVSRFTFRQKLPQLRQRFPSIQVNGQNVNLNWALEYAVTEPEENQQFPAMGPVVAGISDEPPQFIDTTSGGRFVRETGRLRIANVTDLDEFPESEAFSLDRIGIPPAPFPDHLRIVSDVYALSALDLLADHVTGNVELDFASFVVAQANVDLYGLFDGRWEPLLENKTIDMASHTISADFSGRIGGRNDGTSMIVAALALLAGDVNGDARFNQLDIAIVEDASKYRTNVPATFQEGDWSGDGFFDQFDIVTALQTGLYDENALAAIQPTGIISDGQTSIMYNADTGELAVDALSGNELTSINIDSVAGIFSAELAANLGGNLTLTRTATSSKRHLGEVSVHSVLAILPRPVSQKNSCSAT